MFGYYETASMLMNLNMKPLAAGGLYIMNRFDVHEHNLPGCSLSRSSQVSPELKQTKKRHMIERK